MAEPIEQGRSHRGDPTKRLSASINKPLAKGHVDIIPPSIGRGQSVSELKAKFLSGEAYSQIASTQQKEAALTPRRSVKDMSASYASAAADPSMQKQQQAAVDAAAEAMRERMMGSLAKEVAAAAAAQALDTDALHGKIMASLTREVAVDVAARAMDQLAAEAMGERMMASITKDVAIEAAAAARKASTTEGAADAMRERMLASLTREVAAEAAEAAMHASKGMPYPNTKDPTKPTCCHMIFGACFAKCFSGPGRVMT